MARGRRRAAARQAAAPAEPQPAAAAAAAPAAARAAAPLPDFAELLAAVESLYRDQLRPYGRILKKRLSERSEGGAAEGSDSSTGCDAGELRALCLACDSLSVRPEEGGEWSTLIIGRPEDFVDIYNPEDVYPEALWAAAAEYFRGLGQGGAEALPGGRYTSAAALAARGLPFLRGRSLGQVCHIMQIAIAQRKLLGYFNGAIVPYDCSTSMMKSRCAQEQRPLLGSTGMITSEGGPLLVVDWETARSKLKEILDSAVARGSEQVPLSNVKRLFRSLYQMELSETALGHSKLTELLQDPRFHDICVVQLKDRGYVVVPASRSNVPDSSPQQPEEQVLLDEASGTARSTSGERSCVADTPEQRFPQLAWPSSPSQPSTARRTRSLPKDLGSSREAQEEATSPFGGASVRSPDSDSGPFGVSLAVEGEPQQERVQKFCVDEPLCIEEAGLGNWTGQSPAYPLMTPSPSYEHANQPLGKSAWEATCRALGLVPWPEEAANISEDDEQKQVPSSSASPEGRKRFCPGEPLCLDDEEEVLSTPSRDPVPPYPVMTPSPQYRDCLAFQSTGRWGLSELDKCAQ